MLVYFLISVLIILFITSLIISLKEIYYAYSWKKKKRPDTAKECYFCKIDYHEDTSTISSIACIHPSGLNLNSLRAPLDCTKRCSLSTYKNDKISFEKAISLTNPTNTIMYEGFRLLSTTVPTTLAIISMLKK